MSLKGTTWLRKSDNVAVRIEADSEASGGRGNRSLRALNLLTRRAFWVTPEGLGRKYAQCGKDESVSERPDERHNRLIAAAIAYGIAAQKGGQK